MHVLVPKDQKPMQIYQYSMEISANVQASFTESSKITWMGGYGNISHYLFHETLQHLELYR